MGQGPMGRCITFCLLVFSLQTWHAHYHGRYKVVSLEEAARKQVSRKGYAAQAYGRRELERMIEDLAITRRHSCLRTLVLVSNAGSDAGQIRVKRGIITVLEVPIIAAPVASGSTI